MKKGNGVIYFALLFVASVLAELYCMIQFRNDYITVIGVGVIVLIAAYLVMDGIKGLWSNYVNERDDMQRAIQNEALEQLDERVQHSEKYMKALYVVVKKLLPAMEEEQNQIAELKGQLVSELSKSQTAAAKLVAKCNRDDNRRLEEIGKETQEAVSIINQNSVETRKEVSDGFVGVQNCLVELRDVMAELEQVMGTFERKQETVSVAEAAEPEVAEEPKGLEVAEKLELEEELETAEEPEVAEEPEAAEELEAEPAAPEAIDPNKPMSPEEIAALFATAGSSEAAAVEEPEVVEEPEAAVESEVVEEPEAAKEPAEEPAAPEAIDPNKPMSSEEIAALIASMGQ